MKFILPFIFCIFSLFAKEQGATMAKAPIIVMETTQGVIEIALKPTIAPKACENILKLAEKGYYDGIVFHRIIKKFMIQNSWKRVRDMRITFQFVEKSPRYDNYTSIRGKMSAKSNGTSIRGKESAI